MSDIPGKKVKERERTVRFFEIVERGDPNQRMEPADWNSILTNLHSKKLGQLVWEGSDRTLIGEPTVLEDQTHLKLMKVRDVDHWIDVYDEAAESVSALSSDGTLVETSVIAFVGIGNIFGMIQGSTSSPTATALAQWMNGLKLFGQVEVDVEPLVSRDAAQKLKRASEVSRIEVKAHTSKASALENRGLKSVSKVLRQVSDDYGPMTVTVIFQASRAKDRSDSRQALREASDRLLAAEKADEVGKVKAKLIYFEADEARRTEDVDFAHQRITAKRKIPTTDADGNPIRNSSAIGAILAVANEHEAELKLIIGTP